MSFMIIQRTILGIITVIKEGRCLQDGASDT